MNPLMTKSETQDYLLRIQRARADEVKAQIEIRDKTHLHRLDIARDVQGGNLKAKLDQIR